MTQTSLHHICTITLLIAVPITVLAQTDNRNALATPIETLSLDRALDEFDADTAPLFPPLGTGWNQIAVQDCIRTLQLFDQHDILETTIPIGLSVATVQTNDHGLP